MLLLLRTWSRVLLEKLRVTQLVKKFPFLELECSLMCSQEPAASHNPEPGHNLKLTVQI